MTAANGAGTPYLVIIDMQRVFADADSLWRAPRFSETLDPIHRLTGMFQDRVTFTRFVAPDKPAGAWEQYYETWPFALEPPDSPIYELVDDLAEDVSRARILTATTFGKWGPELAEQVGAGPLVLGGVSTDCCVLSTALGAADAGVQVRVVSDACAGATDDTHLKALDIMRLYEPLINVVRLSEVAGP